VDDVAQDQSDHNNNAHYIENVVHVFSMCLSGIKETEGWILTLIAIAGCTRLTTSVLFSTGRVPSARGQCNITATRTLPVGGPRRPLFASERSDRR